MPLWTPDRVREVLPIVTLRHTEFPGWTPSSAVVEGDVRHMDGTETFAVVVYLYEGALFHAYFTWDALADALNAGQPIPY